MEVILIVCIVCVGRETLFKDINVIDQINFIKIINVIYLIYLTVIWIKVGDKLNIYRIRHLLCNTYIYHVYISLILYVHYITHPMYISIYNYIIELNYTSSTIAQFILYYIPVAQLITNSPHIALAKLKSPTVAFESANLEVNNVDRKHINYVM